MFGIPHKHGSPQIRVKI